MNAIQDPAPDSAQDPAAPTRLDAPLLRIAMVVVIGTVMSILDTTVVNVAIKDLARIFDVSLATMQWVSTGYMLALATVIPLTGWAADRFGTKRLYMTSILLFLAGSALSGAAWSPATLILFRVLQGFGGGMITPAGMTILRHAAGPRRIARLMGIIGVPMLLGPIFGPVLGGWLVDDASWRWIFFINLPIGAVGLYAAARILPPDQSKARHALDWPGLLLVSPGLAIFVFGLARVTAAGNLSGLSGDGCVALGLVLIGGFVLHALRREDPLIDMRLFGRRTFGAAALTTFLFGTAFFGISLILALYFQLVRGAPALDAGLLLAPQGFGAMLSMPIASRLVDRIGPGKVVLAGLALVGLAMLSLAGIAGTTPFWWIEPTLFVSGLGMGATMMPAMSAALADLQHHEIARATSGLNVVQRVGGSIGTALLTVILTQQMGGRDGHGADPVTLGPAFGHTFRWSFALVVMAMIAALFLPRSRSGRPAGEQPGAEPAVLGSKRPSGA
ncbi:DHA2 family efflux MFS transporter permease subunit [Nguyenibacter vanlangensis]|uniref:DHA2 family efflux MFS transporter permease subunit n=1 Tax=Nguyenibacter vanlangensis TaxID=1216886 RepID=A0ABZ3D049_9PROT